MAGITNFNITDDDRDWVHESFQWLIKSYGYPDPDFSAIQFTDEYFPNAIGNKKTAIEPLLTDLCNLFQIQPSIISFEIVKDIRDAHGVPYEMTGGNWECELEVINIDGQTSYKLRYANSLLEHPKRIVFNSVFHFIQIKLGQGDAEWVGNKEHYFTFYLIGIYTGWGVILAQTMTDTGKENYGGWEKTWRYISPMPVPIMAYSLALHSSLIEQANPAWKKFLPADIRSQFEKAALLLSVNPAPVFNKQELLARKAFYEALSYADERAFDLSTEAYQKVLMLTNDDHFRSTIYNNIGYNLLWHGHYEKSVFYFNKAIELNPSFAYAYDNLGFAFIMRGDAETGKHYLTIALETLGNDPAYSYRNLALYYQARKEMHKAKETFIKAFDHISQPVDFLDYFYARFLFETENKEEAMAHLDIAVERDEPLAVLWMNKIRRPS